MQLMEPLSMLMKHCAQLRSKLINLQTLYAPAAYRDPRDAGFVKLNGKSEAIDWRNCETLSRGYLFISEDDFRLDPEFEVCMRNKGYVLSTESGPTTNEVLTAQVYQPTYSSPSTYQPSSYSSGYPGYVR